VRFSSKTDASKKTLCTCFGSNSTEGLAQVEDAVKLNKYAVQYKNNDGSGYLWFPVLATDAANALARVENRGFPAVKAGIVSEIEIDGISDADERESLLALQEAPPESWEPAG
jgi:hypothetical protein